MPTEGFSLPEFKMSLNCSVRNQTWDSVEITCGSSPHEYTREEGKLNAMTLDQDSRKRPTKTDNEKNPEEKLAELTIDSDLPKYLVAVRDHATQKIVQNVTGD